MKTVNPYKREPYYTAVAAALSIFMAWLYIRGYQVQAVILHVAIAGFVIWRILTIRQIAKALKKKALKPSP